jgi:hypothetical protein
MAIARIWRTRIDQSRTDEYLRFAQERSLPMFRSHAGFAGVVFGGAEDKCVVITFWQDVQSARALDVSPRYQQTVLEIKRSGFIVGPSSVEVYLVQGGAFDQPIF